MVGPDGVSATVNRDDGTDESVHTSWLIGCDGAHSRVRHFNGLNFPGEEDPHQYVLADVVVDAPISRDEWHGLLTDRGSLYFFLLPALHRRYGAETGGLYLIRPDGYVGYRDRQARPGSLRDYMRKAFG